MPLPPLIPRLRAALRGRLMVGWLTLCLLLVAASYGVIGWVVWPQRHADQIFPIHYTIYFGVDRVGPWWQTFLPAFIATAVLLGNLVFMTAFSEREPLLARLIAVLTLSVLAVLFAGSVFVALLNIP